MSIEHTVLYPSGGETPSASPCSMASASALFSEFPLFAIGGALLETSSSWLKHLYNGPGRYDVMPGQHLLGHKYYADADYT